MKVNIREHVEVITLPSTKQIDDPSVTVSDKEEKEKSEGVVDKFQGKKCG